MAIKGLFSARPAEDTRRVELTWCAGPTRMRHDMQGHVAEPREPTQRAGGTQVRTGGVNAWHGPRKSMRMPGWRPWQGAGK